MTDLGPFWPLLALGWTAETAFAIAAAVLAVLARRRRATVLTVLTAAMIAAALLVAASVPGAAPGPVLGVATLALLVAAVLGGGPVVRLVLDRTRFEEQEGVHGGIVVAGTERLRGGEMIGLLERLAVAGSIIAGVPEALAVVIAIKGVGRFTELEDGAVRERFIVGTLASWIWAAAAAGVVLLARS